MNSRELRALARKNLQGKWGKSAILTLIYWIITFGISFLILLSTLVLPINKELQLEKQIQEL